MAIEHVNTIDERIRYITKCIKSPLPLPPPPPGGLNCCRGSIVVYLLFYAPPIVCGGSVLVFVLVCITLTFLGFVIILTRTRELVSLLLLHFGCLVTVNVF